MDTQVTYRTGLGADEFAASMRKDQERWGNLIRRFSIQGE